MLNLYNCSTKAENWFSVSKAKVDKLDIDKLTAVPADLSKLRNLIENEVV